MGNAEYMGLISRVSSRTYRSFTTTVTNMEQKADSRSFQKQATIKVVQNKLNKTVQKRYVKYQRFEKRHKMVSAHVSPCWRDIAVGDLVTIGECRPLSKTINFNVVKINKVRTTKKGFGKF